MELSPNVKSELMLIELSISLSEHIDALKFLISRAEEPFPKEQYERYLQRATQLETLYKENRGDFIKLLTSLQEKENNAVG